MPSRCACDAQLLLGLVLGAFALSTLGVPRMDTHGLQLGDAAAEQEEVLQRSQNTMRARLRVPAVRAELLGLQLRPTQRRERPSVGYTEF